MSDTYLTAAGSILTTEARHSAYLRAAVGEVPFAQAFDNPLDLKGVYTVASPSIAFRPSGNSALPVKAFPALTMSSMDAVMTGSQVQLMAGSGFNATSSDVNAAFITVTGPVWAPPKSMGDGKFTITIPKGVAGQSYVVLTKGNNRRLMTILLLILLPFTFEFFAWCFLAPSFAGLMLFVLIDWKGDYYGYPE